MISQRTMRSTSVGDDFVISVAVCGPREVPPELTLVITDADGFFGTAVDTVQSLQLSRWLPPTLVIGVGYPGAHGLIDTIQVRARDLTHSVSPVFEHSGGGLAFSEFIHAELLPWAAAEWPSVAGGDTIYFGHSLGGLFGCQLLLASMREGGLASFDHFIVSSPSLWWRGHEIFDQLAGPWRSTRPRSVYAAIGGEEDQPGREAEGRFLPEGHPAKPPPGHHLDMVGDLDRFVQQLTAAAPTSLRHQHEVIPNEMHITVGPTVLSRGLRAWRLGRKSETAEKER